MKTIWNLHLKSGVNPNSNSPTTQDVTKMLFISIYLKFMIQVLNLKEIKEIFPIQLAVMESRKV